MSSTREKSASSALSPSEITVAVRLNGELTRRAGRARLTVMLPAGATVEMLFVWVSEEYPLLTDRLEQAIPVVNGRHANRDLVLEDGQEVALLMPVAGGSGRT